MLLVFKLISFLILSKRIYFQRVLMKDIFIRGDLMKHIYFLRLGRLHQLWSDETHFSSPDRQKNVFYRITLTKCVLSSTRISALWSDKTHFFLLLLCNLFSTIRLVTSLFYCSKWTPFLFLLVAQWLESSTLNLKGSEGPGLNPTSAGEFKLILKFHM